jgi:hypothetical protein
VLIEEFRALWNLKSYLVEWVLNNKEGGAVDQAFSYFPNHPQGEAQLIELGFPGSWSAGSFRRFTGLSCPWGAPGSRDWAAEIVGSRRIGVPE